MNEQTFVVLSLFDGMSCGREAIRQLGVPNSKVKYFASEVDEHAIAVAQSNFPDTIQLGDVRKVNYIPVLEDITKSYLVGADGTRHIVGKVDLLLGGSPCQGVSRAGNREMLAHSESVLFQEYMRLLNNTDAQWFLFENVRSKIFEEYVTSQLKRFGAKLYKLDSIDWASARRPRNYWTNILFDTAQPPTPSAIGAPLTMQEIIGSDYEGIWKRRWGPNDIRQTFRPKVEKMYTLTKSAVAKSSLYFPIRTADLVHLDKFNAQPTKIHPELTFFTSVETEQMHGLPVGYTRVVSDVDAMAMIGNAWTVQVICDLLRRVFLI